MHWKLIWDRVLTRSWGKEKNIMWWICPLLWNVVIVLLFVSLLGKIKNRALFKKFFSLSVMSNSLATPRTVVCQAPLSMGFPRQEFWSGLPFSSSGYLPNSGVESVSPALQVNSLPLSHQGSPFKNCTDPENMKPGCSCSVTLIVWFLSVAQVALSTSDRVMWSHANSF